MPIRVVLVDDVEEYRHLIRTALRVREGFEVVGEAADGVSAVEIVADARPDVIVLDLGLPDLPGREVISRIRAASPESGVVVFTGTYLEDKLGVRPLVEAYVLKDIDIDLLVQVLADVGAQSEERTPVVLDLPHSTRSPARARSFVRAHCTGWGLDHLLDSAELVVTELVTNAVVHAQTQCQVRLMRSGTRLRVEVLDGGGGSPDMQFAGKDDERGRGMLLVSMLSGAWGVDSGDDGGKRVWADLVTTGVGTVTEGARTTAG